MRKNVFVRVITACCFTRDVPDNNIKLVHNSLGHIIVPGIGQRILSTPVLKISSIPSIFQAEAKAICEAAQWFRLNRLDSENYVCIFTDSQATLQVINNPHVTSKLIEDTQLNLLGKTVKAQSIHWIEASSQRACRQ